MSNVHSEDYYEVMGLKKDCTEAEIKKAYKKMAIRWHPDKNRENMKEAEENFKNVGEAYDVLSDPDKRAVYDRYGKEGLAAGGGSGGPQFKGFNGGGDFYTFQRAEDIFNQFFGGRDPFADFFDDDDTFFGGGFGGRMHSQQKQKKQKGSNQMRDPFGGFGFGGGMFGGHDDFFGGGLGGGFGGMDMGMGGFGGGGFSSVQSSSFSGGGPGSSSIKTQSYMKNGKKVTRTEKTTTDANGNKHTEVTEETTDGHGRREKQSYMLDNGSQGNSSKHGRPIKQR